MQTEKFLELVNAYTGKDFKSVYDVLVKNPEMIEFLKDPEEKDVEAFLKTISTGKKVPLKTVEKILLMALRKWPSNFCNNSNVVSVLVYYPEILNDISVYEKNVADKLFIRVLYRRRVLESNTENELITFIKKPTFRMKWFSARFEPSSIRVIKEKVTLKREKIVCEALRNDPSTIQYVENPTYDDVKLVLGLDYSTLRLIKDQDDTIASLAFTINMDSIKFMNPDVRKLNYMRRYISYDNNLTWVTLENFNNYNFSTDEIEAMLELGSERVTSMLKLLSYSGKVVLPETNN